MLNIVLILVSLSDCGTFSIAAVDPETEEYGVAVASRVLDVGYVVPWVEAGVGAVATQALSNPYIGPRVLDELKKGKTAGDVLRSVLADDTIPDDRQVGVVDRNGNSISHTGKTTTAWAGHKTAPNVAIQGNILTGPEVVDSMFAVFERTAGPLAERLLSALEAGERAGGDSRGKQSASLIVATERGGYLGVDDRLVDLKVVDNPEPVQELRRQYELWQYAFMAPAYLRLAEERPDMAELLLRKTYSLLLKALASDLESPEVYNSLAWEFALLKKYPKEALEAAKKAHALAPEDANIMDTVAEAFYAAGNYEEAVRWETNALKVEPENAFFQRQLTKFREALLEKD
ncbi:MAG: DUF1028 domain-containing protein [candidate division WOR-3 bacterium]|nr:MAG: DUF1028 domain-containing protein [candidate division WOR-3 bacterium]